MRASMTAGNAGEKCKGLSCLFGDPRGFWGAVALTAMAVKNGRQNSAALEALKLKPGDHVLEIGCGPGMGLRAALKRVGREGFAAGVDQSATAAHYATHVVHNACLQGRAVVMRAGAADMPFRDALFDKAFAVNSFHFWPDPARALREIARVLAPKGRLVITQRASRSDGPIDGACFDGGIARSAQATALLKAQGWQILDERCERDGARLLAVTIIAERPA